MNFELDQEQLCLAPKQFLKVRGGVGHAIVCHSGSVWVTQHRDRRDIVLGAGESFTLDRDGLALVQALEQSSVSIATADGGWHQHSAVPRGLAFRSSRFSHRAAGA